MTIERIDYKVISTRIERGLTFARALGHSTRQHLQEMARVRSRSRASCSSLEGWRGLSVGMIDYDRALEMVPSLSNERELAGSQVLNLPVEHGSDRWFELLDVLERLGFDLYTLLSVPKGDVYFVTHGDPQVFKSILLQEVLPERKRGQALRNKALKRKFRQNGQFHIRIYRGDDDLAGHIILSGHVDPPDLRQHVHPGMQVRGQVRSDYEAGESLLVQLGEFIKKMIDTQGNRE